MFFNVFPDTLSVCLILSKQIRIKPLAKMHQTLNSSSQQPLEHTLIRTNQKREEKVSKVQITFDKTNIFAIREHKAGISRIIVISFTIVQELYLNNCSNKDK